MRKLIAVLCLLSGSVCLAGEARLKITLPAKMEDGVTATPTTGPDSIMSVRVEYGTCTSTNAFGSKIGETMLRLPVANPVVLTGWNTATYCIRASAITVAGVEGQPGSVLRYVVAGLKPGSVVVEASQ
jgi:hypothetical protein